MDIAKRKKSLKYWEEHTGKALQTSNLKEA